MRYIKPKSLLDDLMYSMTDQSADMRRRMLSWLNASMQAVLNEPREWNFLKRFATLTITGNAITLPVDFDRVLGVGNKSASWYLDNTDEMSLEDAFRSQSLSGNYPTGYVIDATLSTLTFYPGATGTVGLNYQASWPGDYPDSTTDTIIPIEFTNLLQRTILTNVYEFDSEPDKLVYSSQLDPAEMKKMRALDNRRRPQPHYSRSGYIGTKRSGSLAVISGRIW